MTERLKFLYKVLDICDKHPGIYGNSYPKRMRNEANKLEIEDTLRKINKVNETI